MQTTGNLGLKKPEGTDYVDIADLNGNMDKLDTEVVKLASPTESGRMSAADKAKLNGIAAGANNYVHPNHTGDVTSNGDGVTAIAPGVIVNADVNAAAAIDASKIGTGIVSNAEYGYLDGVTSGIQAQLNARPLLTTTPQQTTADITFYVRTDGNDSNNGLANTAGGAFKTIQKAVDAVPQNINHPVIINVGPGTYAEKVSISGFGGRNNLTINGAETATSTHTVNGFDIFYNSVAVSIKGFTGTRTDAAPFNAVATFKAFFYRCIVTSSSASYAFNADDGALMYLGQCIISNRGVAVYAQVEAQIFTSDLSGASNTVGYRAYYGGKITVTGTLVSSANGYETQHGGAIFTGSGVLNPWGDNTTAKRSGFRANLSGTQVISANTTTKLAFGTKLYDNFSEYNPTLYRFTSNTGGTYVISASATVISVPDGCRTILDIVKSGTDLIRVFDHVNGGVSDIGNVR
jgi:hypothetical protein